MPPGRQTCPSDRTLSRRQAAVSALKVRATTSFEDTGALRGPHLRLMKRNGVRNPRKGRVPAGVSGSVCVVWKARARRAGSCGASFARLRAQEVQRTRDGQVRVHSRSPAAVGPPTPTCPRTRSSLACAPSSYRAHVIERESDDWKRDRSKRASVGRLRPSVVYSLSRGPRHRSRCPPTRRASVAQDHEEHLASAARNSSRSVYPSSSKSVA